MTKADIELKEVDGKFVLKLIFILERAGTIEFTSSFPDAMSRREAEARLFRLSETYGFDREDFPVSS
jgi:hypothetical protein